MHEFWGSADKPVRNRWHECLISLLCLPNLLSISEPGSFKKQEPSGTWQSACKPASHGLRKKNKTGWRWVLGSAGDPGHIINSFLLHFALRRKSQIGSKEVRKHWLCCWSKYGSLGKLLIPSGNGHDADWCCAMVRVMRECMEGLSTVSGMYWVQEEHSCWRSLLMLCFYLLIVAPSRN